MVSCRLATICGARALGIEAVTGTLTAGKPADLAVVTLPETDANDPYRLLFDSGSRITGAMSTGRWIEPPTVNGSNRRDPDFAS